jgi:hypothetical protein
VVTACGAPAPGDADENGKTGDVEVVHAGDDALDRDPGIPPAPPTDSDLTSGRSEPVFCGATAGEAELAPVAGAQVLAAPPLPKAYVEGHFRFLYTTDDSNPAHNSSLTDIKSVAKILNAAWDAYAADFREPKHYLRNGVKTIDLQVYDIATAGSTSHDKKTIWLDAQVAVKDVCHRASTAVHELFHRVQYAYGLTTDSMARFAAEGTATWAIKWLANESTDWIGYMDVGFRNPDQRLWERAYDTINYWVYLGERAGSERRAVRGLWEEYETNGNYMWGAIDTVVLSEVSASSGIDQFGAEWALAGFMKDVSNPPVKYDYDENDLVRSCGGTSFGPLPSVPRSTATIKLNLSHRMSTRDVNEHGSDYYVYDFAAGVRRITVTVDTEGPTGNGYYLVWLKNGAWSQFSTVSPGEGDYTFDRTLPTGVTHVALVVAGTPWGGEYSVVTRGYSE